VNELPENSESQSRCDDVWHCSRDGFRPPERHGRRL